MFEKQAQTDGNTQNQETPAHVFRSGGACWEAMDFHLESSCLLFQDASRVASEISWPMRRWSGGGGGGPGRPWLEGEVDKAGIRAERLNLLPAGWSTVASYATTLTVNAATRSNRPLTYGAVLDFFMRNIPMSPEISQSRLDDGLIFVQAVVLAQKFFRS